MPNSDYKRLSYDKAGNLVVDLYSDQPPAPRGGGQPVGQQPTQTLPKAEKPGALERVGATLGATAPGRAIRGAIDKATPTLQNPGFARLMGSIGSALSAREPTSWQHQMGNVVQETAAGRQQEMLRRRETLEGMTGFGMTPQERANLVAEAMAGEEFGLKKEGLELDKTKAAASNRYMQALESSLAPYEDKYRQEKRMLEQEGEIRKDVKRIPSVIHHVSADGQAKAFSVTAGMIAKYTPESLNAFGQNFSQTGQPDYTILEDQFVGKIPAIAENTRQNYINSLFETIREKMPRESFFRGKMEMDNLDKWMEAGKHVPPQVKPLIDALYMLRDRKDLVARASDASDEMKQEVIATLSAAGINLSAEAAPVGGRESYNTGIK